MADKITNKSQRQDALVAIALANNVAQNPTSSGMGPEWAVKYLITSALRFPESRTELVKEAIEIALKHNLNMASFEKLLRPTAIKDALEKQKR